ncbi:cupin domain-containing protein [Lysinibacillus fusiformis]|uniref:cupin domain-containing protein n=1 Tax=Lysinibacillus fusiformis TaxID=28031 RepID=UPI003015E56B
MAKIPQGARIPEHDYATHDEDEYCYVVSGSMIVTVDHVEYVITAGDATYIIAGEAHVTTNRADEVCEVVWTLVKPE